MQRKMSVPVMKVTQFPRRFLSSIMNSVSPDAIKIDRFRCAKVDLVKFEANSLETPDFEKWLKSAENDWQNNQVRGIWFTVPLSHSIAVPILVKHHYVYHHAKADRVVMVKWISETEPNNIPPYPFTNIGVGGMVVDSQNRVLVIQEKYTIKGLKLWKFPGGTSNQGEDISETVEREVEEETGIKGKFKSILAFRHLHKYQFGCSDIYVVCCLTVDESNPNALTPTKCDHEIDAVKWMPISEALDQMSEFNRFVVKKYLLYKETGFSIAPEEVTFILGGTMNVYSVQKDSHIEGK